MQPKEQPSVAHRRMEKGAKARSGVKETAQSRPVTAPVMALRHTYLQGPRRRHWRRDTSSGT